MKVTSRGLLPMLALASACSGGELGERTEQRHDALDGFVLSAEEIVSADSSEPKDDFGVAVELAGDRLLVARRAPLEDRFDVYAFERGAAWSQAAQLMPNDVSPFRWNQAALRLSADEAFVGTAQSTADGAVLVFDATTWSQTDRIDAPPTTPGWFGYSLAVDGDTMVVGDPKFGGANSEEGAAHVFVREAGSWSLQQTLQPPAGEQSSDFGWDVALRDDAVLVSDPRADTIIENGGAVYAYLRSGTSWSHAQTLTSPVSLTDGRFGLSLSLSGDSLAVGEPDSAGSSGGPGKVHVYRDNAGSWSFEATLAPDGTTVDARGFGIDVALAGKRLVVGAHPPSFETDLSGSAWLYYDTDASGWQLAEPLGTGADPDARMGHAVSASGEGIAVGEPGRSTGNVAGRVRYRTFTEQSTAGITCDDGSTCTTGFCVDGVCCDSACDDPCTACSAAKKGTGQDGTCEPVVAGPEPDGACPADATCPEVPTCDGAGKCVCTAAGTSFCTDDALSRVDNEGNEVSCEPFLCRAGSCLDQCASAADCAPGARCSSERQCEISDAGGGGGDDGGCCTVAGRRGADPVAPWAFAALAALVFAWRRSERRAHRQARHQQHE